MKRPLLLLGTLALISSASAQVSVSDTFYYTGGQQTFTVTDCMSNLVIKTWGAEGANANDKNPTNASGGLGGYAEGELAVTGGQTLYIFVGGAGDVSGAGGYNGGGNGGSSSAGSSCFGGPAGGGGGASDVRFGGTSLADRIIVAAGGGGAGRDYCNGTCQPCGCGGAGGGAGGATGVDGDAAYNCGFGYDGTGVNFGGGADAVSGGAFGPQDGGSTNVGTDGALGLGGNGSDGQYDVAGGGGGGGYYGGGGGGGASNGSGVGGGGGGGGSSYTGTLTNPSMQTGVSSGNGMVVIEYILSTPVNVTYVETTTSVCEGDTLALTSGSPTGGVFSGSGISGTDMVADSAGVGLHVITYTYTDSLGCSASDSDTIEVLASPTVALTLTDIEACNTETAVALDGGLPIGGTYTGVGVTSPNFDATAGTIGENYITYWFTDSLGCTNSAVDTINVIQAAPVSLVASTDSICSYETEVVLTGTPTGGNYSGSGVSGSIFNPSTAGVGVHTVSYDIVDSNACPNAANINITVLDCASLSELGEGRGLVVFPNPIEDQATFVISGEPIQNGSYQLVDANGKVVQSNSFSGNSAVINRNELKAGVYFLNISSENNTKILKAKLIVQ